jgi:hypothetical protein
MLSTALVNTLVISMLAQSDVGWGVLSQRRLDRLVAVSGTHGDALPALRAAAR